MKILKVEKLTNEKWVNLFAAQYENRGHVGRWVFASRQPTPHTGAGGGDAVIIAAALHAAGAPPRLVLIREFRIPVGGYVYGLPAGLLEPGEAPEECVRRELLEETGLELVAVRLLTPPLLSSAGLTDETAALAFVDVRATDGVGPKLEASEDLEVVLVDREQAGRLCADPTIRADAKAWMVLHLFSLLGRLA
jgi:ADP-ribose pyrophosphatase